LGLAVPLSRFTSRVGGGSAFFVRHRSFIDFMYIGPQSKSGKMAAGILQILTGGAGLAGCIYFFVVGHTGASFVYPLLLIVSISSLFHGIKSIFYELRHDA